MNKKVRLSVFALVLIAGMFLAACGPLPAGAEIQVNAGGTSAQVEFTGTVDSISAFVGLVETIAPDAWVVSSMTFAITSQTEIKDSIIVGDTVKMEALVNADGTFTATEIKLNDSGTGTPTPGPVSGELEMTGTVESIAADQWIVSGVTFAINPQTEIKGTINVGDMVKVEALVGSNGVLTASEIKLADETSQTPEDGSEMEFAGVVESIGPDSWTVGGKTFAITLQTEVNGTINVGDLVKIEALVGTDGALTAREIKLADETSLTPEPPSTPEDELEMEFTGVVESIGMDSWTVGGKTFAITLQTEIKGTIKVGDLVKIEALVGSDGEVTAREIKLADEISETPEDGSEMEFSGVVESIGLDSWTVDGKILTITPQTKIEGTIIVGDTVKVKAFSNLDGTLTAREIQKEDSPAIGTPDEDDDDHDSNPGSGMSSDDSDEHGSDQGSGTPFEGEDHD